MYKKIFVLITIIILVLFLSPLYTLGVTTHRGIDVSHYQGTINWAEVATDNIEFAIIKATEGTTFTDQRFKENATNAYDNNIAVGAYHLARFTSVEEAISEAEFFLETIKGVKINYALALDLEYTNGLDPATLTAAAAAFLQKVETAGYRTLLYSYQYFFLSSINYSSLEEFSFWVARYSSNPPTVPYAMWQYSSTGTVAGISGNVDMNIAYLDLRQNTNTGSGGSSSNNTTSNETNTNTNNETTNTTNETNTNTNNETTNTTNETNTNTNNETTNTTNETNTNTNNETTNITNETNTNTNNETTNTTNETNTNTNNETTNTTNETNTNTIIDAIIDEIEEDPLRAAIIVLFIILLIIAIIVVIILLVADYRIR